MINNLSMRLGVMALVSSLGLFAQSASAASDSECAIWLCLPTGFPDGCDKAHEEMLKRLAGLKPPLPPYAACIGNNSGGDSTSMAYEKGIAAFVPEQDICRYSRRCGRRRHIEAHWVKNARCQRINGEKRLNTNPDGNIWQRDRHAPRCTRERSFIQIRQNGSNFGSPFFFSDY